MTFLGFCQRGRFQRSLCLRFMPFSQRFIDHLLPLSDLMPSAGHLAIAGLDLRIGYSPRRTLAFVRLLPTDIGPAPHDASSRIGPDLES